MSRTGYRLEVIVQKLFGPNSAHVCVCVLVCVSSHVHSCPQNTLCVDVRVHPYKWVRVCTCRCDVYPPYLRVCCESPWPPWKEK